MKKIFTLAAVVALGSMMMANAENRSWDFRSWSSETIANLQATGSNWSDIEKAADSEPTAMSKDNCYWQVSASADISADGYLMANGVVIKELEGLKYTNTSDRTFAIAINYPDVPNDGFGPYEGGKYIWLGSSKKNYFLIPEVAPGSVIKMGVESHKKSDARGVNLYVGAGNSGQQLMDPDGNAVPAPTLYEDLVWQVPADLDAASDIQIYNTNGCHIYYITVEEGDDNSVAAIAANAAAPVYYNLQGQRVDNPDKGIYILKQGSKVSKVVVK